MWVHSIAFAHATSSASRAIVSGERLVVGGMGVCEAADWKHRYYMGTLGAALAGVGEFDEAARWQTEALPLYSGKEKPAGQARFAKGLI
jgi:hypothetical protein